MEEATQTRPEPYSIGKSAAFTGLYTMFLSLFLLLLTFFVLLNSMSRSNQDKARHALHSVNEVFAGDTPSKPAQPVYGADVSIASFGQDMKQVTASLVEHDKLTITNNGDTVIIRMPVSYLFIEGRNELRKDSLPYIEQMAGSLGTWLKGYRIDIECLMGVANADNAKMEIARAGTLARYLVNAGLPADTVAIGLKEGERDTLTLRFALRRDAVLTSAPIGSIVP